MSYRQLTAEERVIIATLHGQGFSDSKIAGELGHRSTIWRERARNRTPHDGFYWARRARNAPWPGGGARDATPISARRNWRGWTHSLRGQRSPQQVSGHPRRTGEFSISHETIYRYVWRDGRAGGGLHEHLRGARKQRRKRYQAL